MIYYTDVYRITLELIKQQIRKVDKLLLLKLQHSMPNYYRTSPTENPWNVGS